MKLMNKKFLITFALATAFNTAQAMENQPQQKNIDSTFFIGGFPTQQPNYLESCTLKLHKVDVNKIFEKQDGNSRLHQAARNGDMEQCTYLLAAKADIFETTDDDKTPLHLAAQYGHFEITKLFLANNALINFDGISPLDTAAQKGYTDICKLLVSAKAMINPLAKCYKKPLYIAVSNRKTETARFLLEHGACPTKTYLGYTPIYIAAYNGQNESLCRLLIEYGATEKVKLALDIQPDQKRIDYIKNLIQQCEREHSAEVRKQLFDIAISFIPINALATIVVDYVDLIDPKGLADVVAYNKAQAALNYKRLCESSEAQEFQQMQKPTQTTSSTSPADSEIKNDENGIPVPAGELPAAVSALQEQIKKEDTNNAQNLDNNLD